MDDELRVIVIATGFEEKATKSKEKPEKPEKPAQGLYSGEQAAPQPAPEPKKDEEPEEDPLAKILEIFNSR
jgi:cell division GTPase FtsZ